LRLTRVRSACVALRPAALVAPRMVAVAPRRVVKPVCMSWSTAAPRRMMSGHGHGPAWETATQHERVERRAALQRSENEASRSKAIDNIVAELGASVSASKAEEATADELKAVRDFINSLPGENEAGFVLETCADGIERPDFVPSLNSATGYIWIEGEKVVVPEFHSTLDWVTSSPMDFHTFEEVPTIKEPPAHEETSAVAAH